MLIVETEWARPVTIPTADTVAPDVLEDCHVARLVTFCVVPSDIFAVAVNCDVAPTAGTDPVTLIEETVADGEVEEPHPTRDTTNPTTMTNEVNHRNINLLQGDFAGLAGSSQVHGVATAVPPPRRTNARHDDRLPSSREDCASSCESMHSPVRFQTS
jgi:hypothetical protein